MLNDNFETANFFKFWKLWKELVILGIPKKYVSLIKTCYEKALRERYLQGISNPF